MPVLRITTKVLRRSQRHEFAQANEVTDANVPKAERKVRSSLERSGGTDSYPTFSSRIEIPLRQILQDVKSG